MSSFEASVCLGYSPTPLDELDPACEKVFLYNKNITVIARRLSRDVLSLTITSWTLREKMVWKVSGMQNEPMFLPTDSPKISVSWREIQNEHGLRFLLRFQTPES